MAKRTFERQSQFEIQCKKGAVQKNALFGDHYIYYNDQNNQQLICVERIYNDKSSLNKDVEEIKKQIFNKHDYILNVLDYSIEVQKDWCATFYILRTFYEFPEKSLKQIIIDRKLTATPLDENYNNDDDPVHNAKSEELTHLLYHQVSAHAELQENNTFHGDINPSTIFRTNKGDFKILMRKKSNQPEERTQLEKLQKGEPMYVSPILYRHLKRNQYQGISHNKTKSDVFSLGLSILEAALEHSIQDIYSATEIDQDRLQKHLSDLEIKFDDNPLFYSSVQKMLELDEEERADFQSLKLAMPDYKDVCDFFYKAKHGMLQEEEDDEGSFNDFSQENQDFQFAPNENYELPQKYMRNEDDYQESNDYDNEDYGNEENNQMGYKEEEINPYQNKGYAQGNLTNQQNVNQFQAKNNHPEEYRQNPQLQQYQSSQPNIQQQNYQNTNFNPYTQQTNQQQNFNPYAQNQYHQNFQNPYDTNQQNKQSINSNNLNQNSKHSTTQPTENSDFFNTFQTEQQVKGMNQFQSFQKESQPQSYSLPQQQYQNYQNPQISNLQNPQNVQQSIPQQTFPQQQISQQQTPIQQQIPQQQIPQQSIPQQNISQQKPIQYQNPQMNYTPQTLSYQPQQQPTQQQTQNFSYNAQPETQPQQLTSSQGETKVINGILHRVIEEERKETTSQGTIQTIRIRRFVPIQNSQSQGQMTQGNTNVNYTYKQGQPSYSYSQAKPALQNQSYPTNSYSQNQQLNR